MSNRSAAGPSLYSILGIPSTATADDVKHAYRQLAQRLHPDHNQAADAAEQFVAVQEAFEVLGDSSKRAAYDRERARPKAPPVAPPPPYSPPPRTAYARAAPGPTPPKKKAGVGSLIFLALFAYGALHHSSSSTDSGSTTSTPIVTPYIPSSDPSTSYADPNSTASPPADPSSGDSTDANGNPCNDSVDSPLPPC